MCIWLLFCGDLTIPYLGRAGYCFFIKVRKNCATALAGHRAAILFNQNLVGRYCEGTKIKYRERKLIYKDGRRIRGVFPDFSKASIFECKLPDNLLKATDDEQFKECIRQLQEQIKRNPSLKKKLGKDRLEQIKNGRIKGYTWHHNEKEGVMQLVDSDVHSKVRHTGGKKLWGGGTEAR